MLQHSPADLTAQIFRTLQGEGLPPGQSDHDHVQAYTEFVHDMWATSSRPVRDSQLTKWIEYNDLWFKGEVAPLPLTVEKNLRRCSYV